MEQLESYGQLLNIVGQEIVCPKPREEICTVSLDNGSRVRVVKFADHFPFDIGILASDSNISKEVYCALWKTYKKENQSTVIGYFSKDYLDFIQKALSELSDLKNHSVIALIFNNYINISLNVSIPTDDRIIVYYERVESSVTKPYGSSIKTNNGTTLYGLDDVSPNSNILTMIYLDAVYNEKQQIFDLIMDNDYLLKALPKKVFNIALRDLPRHNADGKEFSNEQTMRSYIVERIRRVYTGS